MKYNKNLLNYLPIICVIFLIAGLLLGKFLYQKNLSTIPVFSSYSRGKVGEVIENIVKNYVDSVNENEITDYTITSLLAHLDPHSSYIPPQKVKAEQERMNGKFEGIGIEFRIIDDTLMVVNTIKGGPSEKVGILSGDRIIGLSKQKISFGKLKTDSLVKLLRGKSGSNVDLIVKRPFQKDEIYITVTRGEIPIFSIDAQIMLNNNVGYIKINRFSYQSHQEFKTAAKKLQKLGATSLIIDVRDNPGGSLNAVVKICDELLENGKNIVYTKGENDRETYNSKHDGDFKNMNLVVLTNQNSASASEILAGALQDNDKATIVGRRTFGKGLVQAVLKLSDNSRINLTISRYYTPSGRCIQKPFEKDKLDLYHNEEIKRWENGELYSKDSIKFNDSLRFKTLNGRTVYGGGGIIPDEFVGLDTSMNSSLLFEIIAKDLIRNYAIKFFTARRIKGDTYKEAVNNFPQKKILTSFKLFCESKQVFGTDKDWITSEKYILNKLSAYVLRVKFGNNGYFKKVSEMDSDIIKALGILTSKN